MGRCDGQSQVKESQPRQRIAVVGSGIAGLTAAHFLAKKHDIVAIYEASERPGLHTHSLNLSGYGAVDVPLRAYSPHYYPNLTKLYEYLNIPAQPVNYSSTGVDYANGQSYFQYYNVLLLRKAIPFLWGRQLSFLKFMVTWRIVRDLLWLVFTGPFFLAPGNREQYLKKKTLGAYLKEWNFSYEFVHLFLYPVMSTLLSCSYAQVDAYPADFILEFYSSRSTTIFTGWARVPDGVETVTEGLLSTVPLKALRLATKVQSVTALNSSNASPTELAKGKVRIVDVEGNTEYYDHVIIATEPNIAKVLWKEQTPNEAKLLSAMDSFTAEILVHQDAGLMPENRDSWSGMNYYTFPQLSGDASGAASVGAVGVERAPLEPKRLDASMTSVWVNRYVPKTHPNGLSAPLPQSTPRREPYPSSHSAGSDSKRSHSTTRRPNTAAAASDVESAPSHRGTDLVVGASQTLRGDLFQTWNPYHQPAKGTLVSQAWMTRAVWTVEGRETYENLFASCQGARHIWLCGSYCSPGVTLLENAVKSSLDLAQDFGISEDELPFKPVPCYESRRWSLTVSFLLYFWRRFLAIVVVALILLRYSCW